MRRLQAVSLVLGFALLAYLVYRIGPSNIFQSIRSIGPYFVILIMASGLRHSLRAAAWWHCFEASQRPVGLIELFNVRLAGEAIRYLSFTGPLLGEPAKAALIRKHLPLSEGLSSVIVENLIYTLGAVLLTVCGLAFLLANITLNRYVTLVAVVISGCSVVAIVLIWRAVAIRKSILASSLRQFGRWSGKEWFWKRSVGAVRVEDNVFNFYAKRKGTFLVVFSIELGAHLVGILEIYLILLFMGVDVTILAAYIIEAVTKLINFAFFFVPGQVGVLEGGSGLLLGALGLGATTGVTLALVEKIRTLFWTIYGLAALTLLLRRGTRPAPVAATAPQGGCGDGYR